MKFEPSEIFKVLGVETRVKIIEILKNRGPVGTKEMAAELGITAAAVSQHLKILRQAGLVRSERKGYWIPYSIDADAMERCRQILSEVCTCGCRGTGDYRSVQRENLSLPSLKNYAKALEDELEAVRQRMKELE